ncbi:MAG: multicopper oxidase type 3 [Herbaspirillum sp.]|nr:multicopper oxidase type 3 [Herbaspirillum sp.]
MIKITMVLKRLPLGLASAAIAIAIATAMALAAASASAQTAALTTVNLTAQRMSTTLPDGTTVPMWGYCTDDLPQNAGLSGGRLLNANACTVAVTGSALRVANTNWTPGPTIVVPVGNELNIRLTNNLASGTSTSLVILGQIGGSAGKPTRDAAPVNHPPQTTTTWPANAAAAGAGFVPPQQAVRARAFGQEAAFNGNISYTWNTNIAPAAASAKYLKPGTYLYETGSHPSLQAPMGLYGVLIVTSRPLYEIEEPGTSEASQQLENPGHAFPGAYAAYAGTASPLAKLAGVPYDMDATLLFSEIDAVQNTAVDAAAVAGTSESIRWNDARCTQSQKPGAAGAAQAPCYPAAVNYAPTYFVVNGKPYNQTSPADTSVVLPDLAGSDYVTGNILVRMVNAGLRTHTPSIVGMPFTLIAEDGNVAPGNTKMQNEVNMPAGKTIDALIHPMAGAPASTLRRYPDAVYPFFDRGLGLTTGNETSGGMQGYIVVARAGTATLTGAALATALNKTVGASAKPAVAATANPDYYTLSPNATSLSNNVLTNDIGVTHAVTQGQTLVSGATSTTALLGHGSVTLETSGKFTYTVTTPPANSAAPVIDSFTYCGNNSATVCALVTITFEATGAAPTAAARIYDNSAVTAYPSNVASLLSVPRGAGLLQGAVDPSGYPMTAKFSGAAPGWVALNSDGSFKATPCSPAPATCTFQFVSVNSQGTSSLPQTATVAFPAGSGLPVRLIDAQSSTVLQNDYSWVIEEDQTWHTTDAGVTPPLVNGTPPPSLATSFFHSYMPVVASGCTGPLSCSDAQAVSGTAVAPRTRSLPSDVALDPTKWYFISILPGDAANPFISGFARDPLLTPGCLTPSAASANDAQCGHTIGGITIAPRTGAGYPVATVKVEPNPLKPAQLSVYIFEDSSPTNGDPDAMEHGLGGFEITIWDVAGRSGDPIGQITYDAFNSPLTNALLGTPGCPNTYSPTASAAGQAAGQTSPNYAKRDLTGVIITCPNDPVDPANPSADYALQGQALVKNLMPARLDVIANSGAARRGAGEIWHQVSTLEGTPAQDAFVKSGEPAYFQEFGPPGFHTFIGFVNPAHITQQNIIATHVPVSGVPPVQTGDTEGPPITGPVALATTSVSGRVTSLHMSRPIMETLWDSGSRKPLAATSCLVGLNQQGELGLNIGFAACDSDGNFTLSNIPVGSYMLVIWDRWLDQIIAFKSVQVVAGKTPDANGNPVPAAAVALGNIPVFSWFTRVETSVYVDQNGNGVRDAGESGIAQVPVAIRFRDGSVSNVLTTDSDGNAVFNELFPLFNWYVVESDRTRFANTGVNVTVDAGGLPDCATYNPANGQGAVGAANQNSAMPCTRTGGILNSSYVWNDPVSGKSFGAVPAGLGNGTNRKDSGNVLYEGLQGFINQTQILDWGKRPLNVGENGGIQGMVVYASTRGFDDPSLELQFKWEPGVPRVKVNLYSKTLNADGTAALTLVNSTTTTSWDDYANGVKADGTRNMVCPGQDSQDPFLTYTLGTANQFKCYDGFHLWNQVQPAVYDGAYVFNTDSAGQPLAPGRYVVEIIPPAGYEIVKEEDKNILIGDAWVAPAAQQFNTLANIFIMPDQAQVAAYYNPNNPNNPTTSLGFQGAKQQFPNCAGTMRTVPDFMSLFPGSGQVAPFAGVLKPLCDRKEVLLADQSTAKASFFIFSNTPVAAHYTGMILNDAATEINAMSPDFGEKFAVPYAPISVRDMNGVEISRVYSDQWGTFNGMAPSTWQVNVPNPSGYSPNMLQSCMNDPGPILDTRPGSSTFGQMITDPLFNPSFSNFCYEWPYMPGATVYLDTPVVPVAAFADGYNPPDCSYPDSTPSIKRVDGDGIGPWVAAADGTHTLKITALGDADVPNPAYQGPSATAAPFNQRIVKRHYGFGSTPGTVSVNGIPLINVSWSDAAITATVPPGAATGELIIRNAAGLSSVDSVTVNVGGPAPAVVKPAFSSPTTASTTGVGFPHPIQDAIDAAKPGNLIIVDEGIYPELVIMWKPVQLQGVGAASVVINAAKYPTQKLEDWRPRINKLFGIDPTTGNLSNMPQVDPLPTQQPITGGIVMLEPTILATEEGSGVVVLSKNLPQSDCGSATAPANGPSDYFAVIAKNNGVPSQVAVQPTGWNRGDSNFYCAKARIDGLSITGSDGGGGIYANGWAHGLEISNNRIYSNSSSMHGGLRIGSPFEEETPPVDGYGYDIGVKIHHNAITKNGTTEFTPGAGAVNATGAGAGVSICTGTDNYEVNYNFICGNYSNGDGGGIGAIGVNMNGVIAHNKILFNQSSQQTAAVHGGGIDIEGDLTTATTLSNGAGNITIDSNLIVGNFAQSGHGGGIRLQQVNGNDVIRNPNNPSKWYRASITNNIITNNVAGWSGGGISLVDTLNAVIHENTIANNDSAAIVGALFGTNGRGPTTSYANPAGVSTEMTSPALLAVLPTAASTTVPPAATKARNTYSNPDIFNDIIWHNRSFFVDATGGAGASNVCSSNDTNVRTCIVLPPSANAGDCTGAPAYWDIGTVGDASAAVSNFTLTNLYNSVLSPAGSIYSSNRPPGVSVNDPGLMKTYCNGPRANPGMKFEPGQPFLPPFSIIAGVTLDEAGNFVDLRYGPLSLTDPLQPGVVLYGDYRISATGSAYNTGIGAEPASRVAANSVDYFGAPRPTLLRLPGYDIGATQVAGVLPIGGVIPPFLASRTAALTTAANTVAAIRPAFLAATPAPAPAPALAAGANALIAIGAPANQTALPVARLSGLTPALIHSPLNCGVNGQPACGTGTLQLSNTGSAALAIANIMSSNAAFSIANNCGSSLAAGGKCLITVAFNPPKNGLPVNGTVVVRNNSGGVANNTQIATLSGAVR